MKKSITLAAMLCIISVSLFGQGGTPGNFRTGANFLGFNAGVPGSLEIRNNFAGQPINFFAGGPQRMTILGTTGFVGIGSGFTTPTSLLHVHQSGPGVSSLRLSTVTTGTTIFDGLEIGISPTGDAFFINNELNQNFSWYNQGGGVPGTLLGRMRLYDGGVGQTTGRLALSNNLPLTFVPIDRIHMYEDVAVGTNAIRQSSLFTGTSATDGYVHGINNSNGMVFHTQFETQPILWFEPSAFNSGIITEVMRLQNNMTTPTFNGPVSTDGFIGLYQNNPIFHIDGITPQVPAGELFVGFNPSDVPNSKMGLLNATDGDNKLLPTFFGNVDASQTNVAFQTIGAIKSAQDIASNNIPVTRFMVGKDWQFNNSPIQDLSEISNRPAFAWHNASKMKMLMDANGRLLIQEGINQLSPVINNRLEVAASAGVGGGPDDPYWNVVNINGASGVRLTRLTNLKTPFVNKTRGVLSVDSVGNIILVYDSLSGGSPGIGNLCGATANPLTADFEIPLAGHNYYFSGQANPNDNVAIGLPCTITPQGKLHILKNSSTNVANSTGLYIQNSETSINNTVFGEQILVNGINVGQNIGIFSKATNSSDNIGGHFEAIQGAATQFGGNVGISSRVLGGLTATGVNSTAFTNVPTGQCMGGFFRAQGGSLSNYGVYALAFGNGSNVNYGVYSYAAIINNDRAGFFDGDLEYTGSLIPPSDKKFKIQIDSIANASNLLSQLIPRQYYYDTTNVYQINFSSKLQYGLIAQEVENVIPNLVGNSKKPAKRDSTGNIVVNEVEYKNLNYQGFISLLIKSHQEQQSSIDSLRQTVQAMQTQMNNCCSTNAKTTNAESLEKLPTYNVNIGNDDLPMLAQNIPNPYGNTTNIQFNIPKNAQSAQIVFFNEQGMILNSVEINTKGRGQINLNAEKLENGLYFYSLIIDGKKVDTKKMVKAE